MTGTSAIKEDTFESVEAILKVVSRICTEQGCIPSLAVDKLLAALDPDTLQKPIRDHIFRVGLIALSGFDVHRQRTGGEAFGEWWMTLATGPEGQAVRSGKVQAWVAIGRVYTNLARIPLESPEPGREIPYLYAAVNVVRYNRDRAEGLEHGWKQRKDHHTWVLRELEKRGAEQVADLPKTVLAKLDKAAGEVW